MSGVWCRSGESLGGIDILVNNAGIFPRVEFLDMTEAQWDEVLNVNLKGTFLCAQAVAQKLVERGRGGAVVNLASSAAFAARHGVCTMSPVRLASSA